MAVAGSRRRTVLFVDDEASVRQSLERYLHVAGFDVFAVGDADSAFVTLCRHVVDAVIVDVRLPKNRSGLEVLEFAALGGDDRGVLRIVLTGVILTAEEEDIIRRYPAYLFYKPHGYAQLVDFLRTRLAARQE